MNDSNAYIRQFLKNTIGMALSFVFMLLALRAVLFDLNTIGASTDYLKKEAPVLIRQNGVGLMCWAASWFSLSRVDFCFRSILRTVII